MYHNTTQLKGDELRDSIRTARTQTDKVLVFFKHYPGRSFTPSYVHSFVEDGEPLTSSRRSISDLTRDGHLEKTEEKRTGIYGKPEYCWRLKFQTTLF